ncbi:MAG: prepilin-type N-terminal cleavage/methylation domain-containing protein [Candidatus Acidiferrales bacterium]|jgi:prepilin-type N-terminal cleavage/methylation domain-containing protein
MQRQNGFTLIELMVSMAILVATVGVVVGALLQAQHATQGVAYEANTQENLRAGMHFMVEDLMQAGEGIPQGGVSVPYNAAGNSAIVRPGAFAPISLTFVNPPAPNGFTVLPALSPGSQQGQDAKTVNPTNGAILDGNWKTDIINILYADNSLQDAAGHYLYSYPVAQPVGPPVCAGTINATGASVTLDAGCFAMPGVTKPITVGNLIMFHNSNGTALEYVTSINGQTINFGAGDPAGLNATGLPNGTVANLQNSGGGFPPTSITRVWLITYYIDSTTNPADPQLIRQVNYPNYPPGPAAVNPPQAIADNVENLGFSYDITGSNWPGIGTYPAGPGNAPTPVLPDTASQIRAANVFLAGRSEAPYLGEGYPQYLRNNLSTQVSIRSLSFTNTFTTASSSTSP